MKFVCEGLDLSEALLKVSKACAARTTVAILECIKVSAYNDELTLLASDGELSIEKKIKADVLEEGEICVPGKTFTDFINKLVGTSVTCRTRESGLEITYGGNQTSLQILPASDFPHIDMNIGENHFSIDKKVFKDIIARTVFCCAQDDSRPILKGCLFEVAGEELTVTALDGFRMAVVKEKTLSASGNLRIVCPARTLNEISRMIDDEGDLTVFVQNGMMMVKIENTTVMSRLYQGEFINYKDITPTTAETEVTVKKEELSESLERAGILIRGDKNSLVVFDIKPGSIRITSNSEIGNVLENVPCKMKGRELRIAMNSKYILDSAKAVQSEEIKIRFNSPISPFVLTAKEEDGSLYLILPVRTNN